MPINQRVIDTTTTSIHESRIRFRHVLKSVELGGVVSDCGGKCCGRPVESDCTRLTLDALSIYKIVTLLKGFAELRGFKLPPSTFRTVDECSVPPILRSM